MRHVELTAVFENESANDVFAAVLRWELPAPESGASWEWTAGEHAESPLITSGVRPRWLRFNSGVLRWNEEIRSYPREREIRFALTDGGFDQFSGKWTFLGEGNDVVVRFEVDFDFGIESMAGILDPIAEIAIRETIERAVLGMAPIVRIVRDTTPIDVPA